MTKRFWLALGIVLSNSTAAQVTELLDLSLVEVRLMDSSTIKNVDLLGKRPRPEKNLLRAEISTVTDLMETAHAKGLNLYAQVSFCGSDGSREIRGWGGVYFEDFSVSGVAASAEEARRYRELIGARHLRPPYRYHVYFEWKSYRWTDVDPDKPVHKAYDLSVTSRSVCVKFVGGAMWGTGGLTTNSVTISRDAIRAALHP